MTVALRDLQRAQHALRKPCRMHAGQKAATCDECATLAEEQRDAQHARQRRAAHRRYLEAQPGFQRP